MNIVLAEAVTLAHFAWIGYVVIGQLLILLGIALGWNWIRNFWFRFTQLTMMLLVAVETIFDMDCPLSVWEKHLRGLPGSESLRGSESESFIVRWLARLFFFQIDAQDWRMIAGYLAFTALVVWSFWKCPPRLPMSTASFVALVHFTIGAILLATAWNQNWGIGVLLVVQASLWFGLQGRDKVTSDK